MFDFGPSVLTFESYNPRILSLSELRGLSFEDFCRFKIVVTSIFLDAYVKTLLMQWFDNNQDLVLDSWKISSTSKWDGEREVEYFKATAFFVWECSNEANSDCSIIPNYKISEGVTLDQISRTPTIIELLFGLLKKYPQYINRINVVTGALDDVSYLKIMHPKSLSQSNIQAIK